jgi:hypothetical protein
MDLMINGLGESEKKWGPSNWGPKIQNWSIKIRIPDKEK